MITKRPDTENENVFDEHGLLKPGATYRVPMQFRDERTVFNDAALHRPGYRRMPTPAADSREAGIAAACAFNRTHAYFDHEIAERSRWKGGPQVGDPCVVDGKHGRLVDENGTLVFRAHSPETARAELETAYADAESYPPSAEGTACTIRQPTDGAHEGAPGIVKNGICVPIAAQGETGDAEYDQQVRTARQQIHDARELAYVLKDIEDRHAWRLK